MKPSLRSASLIVVAAACGWFVRGVESPEPLVAAAHDTPPAVARAEEEAPPRRVASLAPVVSSVGGRDLFKFREAPPVVVVAPLVTKAAALPPHSEIVAAPEVVVQAPPAFNYRFIGFFGPKDDRIAAFVRDGQVVTARPGDRVGDFVVKAIGLETVEVESAGGMQRVPLGG